MNETNSKTETVVDQAHEAPVDLVQLLHTYMPREALRRVVIEQVKLALACHARDAAATGAADGAMAWADEVAGLRRAPAVALPSELCTLMARVGFDKSLFTYGQLAGRAVGFAEGVWLLKFVGFTDDERTTAAEPVVRSGERAFARQA